MSEFRLDAKTKDHDTITLTIIFRHVMLFFGTGEGFYTLVPSEAHHSVLRDVKSDSTINLHRAFISLVSATQLAGCTELLDAESRLPSMERITRQKHVAPRKNLLDTKSVHKSLNALAFLPAGRLTTYPPAMFPDKADVCTTIVFNGEETQSLLTDTVVYTVTLPRAEYRLRVSSPRCVVEFAFETDARFELSNLDDKVDDVRFSSETTEMKLLIPLLELHMTSFDTDDVWPCNEGICGHFEPVKRVDRAPCGK